MIDKNAAGDDRLFAQGWLNVELTPAELAELIDEGVAYSCQLVGGTRKAANFLAADVLSVDIDGVRRIEDVLEDEIVRDHLTILYTTPSHTPERHRFRLIFALPRTIESAIEMSAAYRSLASRLGGDPSATDASRLFYGSRGSKPQVFDRPVMDERLLDELIQQGLDTDQRDSSDTKTRATTVARNRIDAGASIRLASGPYRPLTEISVGTSVHCPFHHDVNASAFVVSNQDQTSKGVYCSTCRQTFWSSDVGRAGYDFFAFDRAVIQAKEYFKEHRDWGPLPFENEGSFIHPGLDSAGIYLSETTHLGQVRLTDGLTFIKSPKGSGKTEALRSLVADGSVLLIGHRVALIRQSCERLELTCYQDLKGPIVEPRLGICLDSLERLVSNSPPRYSTIIIDESEQVLSHFLSDTLRKADAGPDRPDRIFKLLGALVRRADRVVALDADLGFATFETLTKLVAESAGLEAKKGLRPVGVYLNRHLTAGKIEVFDSLNHLVADLMGSLADGKRVYVTSNSKARINKLEAAIQNQSNDLEILKVTSETVGDERVRAFIENAKERALDYDVILGSPSVGTGIDITFPENMTMIDVVYGFFDSPITTHFDCDQQLARVRHPGAIRVWLSPRIFNYETSVDVVKRDLQFDAVYKNLLVGYDDDLRPRYHTDDAFTDMTALIVSQQRASKNNLKRHFIDLKRHQGYTVKHVSADDELVALGGEAYKRGTRSEQEKYVDDLLGAKTLDKSEHDEIRARLEDNLDVSQAERLRMDRTRIELFYRREITLELIALDDRGKLRKKVMMYEEFMAYADHRKCFGTVGERDESQKSEFRRRFQKKPFDVNELLRKLLIAAGVWDGETFQVEKTITSDDLGQFVAIVSSRKAEVENLLDVEVRKDLTTKPMVQLKAVLAKIGLTTTLTGNARSKKVQGGRKIYQYALDHSALATIAGIAEDRKALRAWAFVNDLHGWTDPEDDEFAPSPRLTPEPIADPPESSEKNIDQFVLSSLAALSSRWLGAVP